MKSFATPPLYRRCTATVPPSANRPPPRNYCDKEVNNSALNGEAWRSGWCGLAGRNTRIHLSGR
ncbi:hypothetical protein E2C01_080065 [Portunus trituberculatus]|uniref:Uncharacterized protein n=1 Tax=Portunus trituberculatus TaxID=210409 RepID=A0A5B7IUF3_PORTR|nr:hypothetical protein [Portunus trituberculatus]